MTLWKWRSIQIMRSARWGRASGRAKVMVRLLCLFPRRTSLRDRSHNRNLGSPRCCGAWPTAPPSVPCCAGNPDHYLHQTSARGQCTKHASIPGLHSGDGGCCLQRERCRVNGSAGGKDTASAARPPRPHIGRSPAAFNAASIIGAGSTCDVARDASLGNFGIGSPAALKAAVTAALGS